MIKDHTVKFFCRLYKNYSTMDRENEQYSVIEYTKQIQMNMSTEKHSVFLLLYFVNSVFNYVQWIQEFSLKNL